MEKKLTAITLVSLLILPFYSAADTIVLKSGRKIEATKCWEDGDLVKCKVYGQVIGYNKSDIADVKIESAPEMPTNQFRFDIWQSGISVQEAIDIAEANDLPLHRYGLISVNKKFNPKMCRPYADTATKFYYKDQIFGKMASLNFDFTPASKKLYSMEIKFLGVDVSKQSEFRQQIESMLREKYGKPIRVVDHLLYKDFVWKINGNATVTMQPIGNAIIVTYRDVMLTNLTENEKLGHVRSGFTKNDKNKF